MPTLTLSDENRKTLIQDITPGVLGSDIEKKENTAQLLKELVNKCIIGDNNQTSNFKKELKKIEKERNEVQIKLQKIEEQKTLLQERSREPKELLSLEFVDKIKNFDKQINKSNREIQILNEKIQKLNSIIEEVKPRNERDRTKLLADQIKKSIKTIEEGNAFLKFFHHIYFDKIEWLENEENLDRSRIISEEQNDRDYLAKQKKVEQEQLENLEDDIKKRIQFYEKLQEDNFISESGASSYICSLLSGQEEGVENLILGKLEKIISIKEERDFNRYEIKILEGLFRQSCDFSDNFINRFFDMVKKNQLNNLTFSGKTPIQSFISDNYFIDKEKVERILTKAVESGCRLSETELNELRNTNNDRLINADFHTSYAKALLLNGEKDFAWELIGENRPEKLINKINIADLAYLFYQDNEKLFYERCDVAQVVQYSTFSSRKNKLNDDAFASFVLKCALKSHSKSLIEKVSSMVSDEVISNFENLHFALDHSLSVNIETLFEKIEQRQKSKDVIEVMVNSLSQDGHGVLQKALKRKEVKIINILVARGANILTKNEGESPLHMIAKGSSFFILQKLIEAQIVKLGNNYYDQLKEILDQKDEFGNTALHYAAQRGHDGSVKYLLENGASPDLKNNAGLTPYALAYLKNATCTTKIISNWMEKNKPEEELQKDFLEADSSLNIPDVKYFSNLHQACANPSYENLKTVLEEAKIGMNEKQFKNFINEKDQEGMAPIHLLAVNGREKMLKLLMEQGGIDLLVQNKKGNTALHLAIKSGATVTAALLCEKILQEKEGLDCNIKNKNGQNFLYLAGHMDGAGDLIKNFREEIRKIANYSGIEIEVVRNFLRELCEGGSKPLIQEMAEKGHDEVIKFLVVDFGILVTQELINIAEGKKFENTQSKLTALLNIQQDLLTEKTLTPTSSFRLPKNTNNLAVEASDFSFEPSRKKSNSYSGVMSISSSESLSSSSNSSPLERPRSISFVDQQSPLAPPSASPTTPTSENIQNQIFPKNQKEL